MNVNFHLEPKVIPFSGVISTLVGSATRMVDEQTLTNITSGKEVFTC